MKLAAPEYRTRVITPIPSEPDFTVEVRKLSSSQLNKIYDRHGYIPGHAKQGGMVRFAKCITDIVTESVVRVNGATDEEGNPREADSDETKLLLIEVDVEDAETGERKSLWQLVQEKAEAMERTEAKN